MCSHLYADLGALVFTIYMLLPLLVTLVMEIVVCAVSPVPSQCSYTHTHVVAAALVPQGERSRSCSPWTPHHQGGTAALRGLISIILFLPFFFFFKILCTICLKLFETQGLPVQRSRAGTSIYHKNKIFTVHGHKTLPFSHYKILFRIVTFINVSICDSI